MAKKYISPSSIKPDTVLDINGVEVCQYFISKHNINSLSIPQKRNGKLRFVVIHNTEDLPKVDDDGRNYIAASINDNLCGVMSSFYVDDLRGWQLLEDDRENWCCSDYENPDGGNRKGVSIEIIMNGADGSDNLKARDNGARIAAWYLYKNGLTVEDGLITHSRCFNMLIGRKGSNDFLNCNPPVGKKLCPYYIIPEWAKFKALVQKYYNELKQPVKMYYVRKSWKEVKTQIGVFTSLDNAKALAEFNYGYKVFNNKGRGCYTPKQYFDRYEIIKKAPVKYSPKTKEKTVDWIDAGTSVTVYHKSDKTAENGTVWVKIKYEKTAAWIPLSYIAKTKG